MNTAKLITAVETYFADLQEIRATGGATDERSLYPPLSTLLNAVGNTLKPKVHCVSDMANQGAGHPDFGLYVKRRSSGSRSKAGNKPSGSDMPERGVVEVKPFDEDAWLTAESDQVSRYWERYRLVLVTNYRDFVLLGENAQGQPTPLETFRLADSADDFERRLQKPRAFAREVGAGLAEYLCRALSHRAVLAEPRDLAWLLASYARDGLARVEAVGDTPSLTAVRAALEEALGVRFEGEKGTAFFRSTLVQTLFYGVFSAWVLWSRQLPPPVGGFNWHEAVWHLRAPVLRALFQQLSDPGRLQPLGLVEVLDWTAAALDRVDRAAFFARFSEGEAVPYFYEPFLEAFDPALRKQLGVWYTPAEVVRYMVARVDKALKDDLNIEDGLADERVYVLDPCCGTGAYLAETLRRIAENLRSRGRGALTGAQVRQAAMKRVFGFEIMPAPFVVAHLQVGLTMQNLDAPLAEDGDERAGIFLTNALTGWEPKTQKPLPFPELEQERERAERVKQDAPILVVLGNPPYNGYAGMAVDEERELSQAYRTTKRVRRPEGQGLNDLYVRFFRMAERRIAEKTGQGIVCFISNYSWLDGLSFTGMRERYLEAFDTIRIDNLHGDRIISEYAPDGRTSETVFSIRGKSPGIRIGTSITMLSKASASSTEGNHVLYRDFHQARADERRQALLESLSAARIDSGYANLDPEIRLGLPFKPMAVSDDWFDWPALPDLFPASFPGVKTSRDSFLVDVDLGRLKERIGEYFDAELSHEEIARRYPGVMQSTARFDARAVRNALLERGGPVESCFVRYAYRPFDTRWLYWEAETKLLDEKRSEYGPHVFEGNVWLEAREREAREDFSRGTLTCNLADNFGNGLSSFFPAWLRDTGLGADETSVQRLSNLSSAAQRYLDRLGLGVEDLFYHVLAVLHDPGYRRENAGALRMEWPRIPLPGWPKLATAEESVIPVKTGIHLISDAAEFLAASAARGRQLAQLLDSDTPVPGVTTGTLRPEIAVIAVPSTSDNRNMTGNDFALTAGWGHYGSGEAVMPGQGKVTERAYTPAERDALSSTAIDPAHSRHSGASRNPETPGTLEQARKTETGHLAAQPTSADLPAQGNNIAVLGATTYDIYFNDRAYWRNVPANVWRYKLGGYQVLKKWLSYREHTILKRPLQPEEVQHFTDTARRIGAILLVTTEPDL